MGLLPNLRAWHLLNTDTGEELEGETEAVDLTETVGGSEYAETTAMNREHPILQFLYGKADAIKFEGVFYSANVLDDITPKLNKLKAWSRRDPSFQRPPVLIFWVGNADISMQCVIEGGMEFKYFRPTILGQVRGARCSINLKQYTEYSLESGPPPETRYHRVREREYFELLAWREYHNAKLGDVIRKRHPQTQLPEEGDIIKLPSFEAISRTPVQLSSLALYRSSGNRESVQRTNRRKVFDRTTARTLTSVIVPTGY